MFYYWVNLPKYKPFDGQVCWVRTVNSFFFPFLAVWSELTESFISVVTGLSYDKTVISRWKEYPVSPGKTISFLSDNTPLNPLRIDINGLKYFYYSINWGDGRTNSGYFTGTIISITHTYSVAADYTVTISTPSASITYLRVNNEPISGGLPNLSENNYLTFLQLSQTNLAGALYNSFPWPLLTGLFLNQSLLTGPVPSLSLLTELTEINLRLNQLTGNFPSLAANSKLIRITLDDNLFTGVFPSISHLNNLIVLRLAHNQFTGGFPDITNKAFLDNVFVDGCPLGGVIPSLSGCLVLRNLEAGSCGLTGYTNSVLALTLVNFNLSGNNLSSANVNQILANFVTNLAARPAVGSINLSGGTMSPPTGQGLIDKAAIIAKGWSCVTA